jgi:SAM-dependent methyltransferase
VILCVGSLECALIDRTPDPLHSFWEKIKNKTTGADLVLLMYSLSAMAPEAMPHVARKLHDVLRPGGRVLLRDYGRWDEAQLRFKVRTSLDRRRQSGPGLT